MLSMSLRGSLATMPALDVLRWAADRGVAAVVTFQRAAGVRSFTIADGAVTSTGSANPDEQLGSILVHGGKLTERALADALELRAAIGVPLGRVLHMSGVLTEAELVDVLTTKVREAVIDVAAWTDGEFELTLRNGGGSAALPATVAIHAFVPAAAVAAPRLAANLAVLGGEDATFFVPSGATAQPPVDAFDLDLERLWKLAAAGFSASRLGAVFGGRRSRVIELLAGWVEHGLLVPDRRRRARPRAVTELLDAAQQQLAAGALDAALELARQAHDQDPGDADGLRMLQRADRAVVARTARSLLRAGGPPIRRAVVSPPPDLGVIERELLARVDGVWDVLSLVRHSPASDAEALRALDRLVSADLIELPPPVAHHGG
jgi:hypothetical protein